jgi:hypothetical protein
VGTFVLGKRSIVVSGISEVPDVQFRRLKEEYKEKTVSANGHEFIVFTKQDTEGFESAAFLYEEGKLLTMALRTTSNLDYSEDFLKAVKSLEPLE